MKHLGIEQYFDKIYGTHISHDGMSYHEEIEKRAIENRYNIVYDGMELEM